MKHTHGMKQLVLAVALALLLSGCAGTLDSMQGTYSTQLGESDYLKGNYSEALVNFKKAADLNNPYACYRLYVMYQYGQGTAKSPTEATRMLEKAASLGDETSQVILGSRLLFSKAAERPRGVQLLEAAASKENRYAYEYLGIAYQQGLGVERNVKRAQEYQRLAVAQGSTMKRFAGTQPTGTEKTTSSSKVEMTKAIQNELRERGYYRGKVDGVYGPMTRDAIARYQKDHDYPVNPVVSEEVLNKIRNN